MPTSTCLVSVVSAVIKIPLCAGLWSSRLSRLGLVAVDSTVQREELHRSEPGELCRSPAAGHRLWPLSTPFRPPREEAAVDPWLVPPDTPEKRVADERRKAMRLSALFEEFCLYERVEKEAAPTSIKTYRWCFGNFLTFAREEVGPTVLVNHFTED